MQTLAVIPCRKGSRSIPNKNTKLLNGKPLFMWTVEQSLKSKCDKVVVSTNDEWVIQIIEDYKSNLEQYGFFNIIERLTYINRPDEISGDHSPTELALIHAVDQIEDKPEITICLQPSNPFRFNGLIDKCIDKFIDEKSDSLLTTLKLYDFFWFEEEDPLIHTWNWYSSYHPKERKMRQQFGREEVKYFDCGTIYITRTEELLKSGCRISGKVSVYPISHLEAFQIDYPEDFKIAEQIFQGKIHQLL